MHSSDSQTPGDTVTYQHDNNPALESLHQTLTPISQTETQTRLETSRTTPELPPRDNQVPLQPSNLKEPTYDNIGDKNQRELRLRKLFNYKERFFGKHSNTANLCIQDLEDPLNYEQAMSRTDSQKWT